MCLYRSALSRNTTQQTVFAADMFTVYPSGPHPPSANWRAALSEFGRFYCRGTGEGFNRLRCDVTGLDLPVCTLSISLSLPLSVRREKHCLSLLYVTKLISHFLHKQWPTHLGLSCSISPFILFSLQTLLLSNLHQLHWVGSFLRI